MTITKGDRVAFRANGHSITRTVESVGDGYVVVMFNGLIKVPRHRITSVIKG